MARVELVFLGLLFLLSALAWLVAVFRMYDGRPLLQFSHQRQATWGLVDVVVVLVLVGLQLLTLLSGAKEQEFKLEGIGGHVAISLGVLAFSWWFVLIRGRTRWRDLGWDGRFAVTDLRIGAVAFLLVAAPIYGIQMLLVQGGIKAAHPLIEALRQDAEGRLLAASGFLVIVVAPVVEEHLYRVILQGWLQKVADPSRELAKVLLGDGLAPQGQGPLQTPLEAARGMVDDRPEGVDEDAPRWPILVSSLVFAFMHYSHGPDPIPLFFLALALGVIYQRTHRILPCIVVHSLLNACSFAMLVVQLSAAPSP